MEPATMVCIFRQCFTTSHRAGQSQQCYRAVTGFQDRCGSSPAQVKPTMHYSDRSSDLRGFGRIPFSWRMSCAYMENVILPNLVCCSIPEHKPWNRAVPPRLHSCQPVQIPIISYQKGNMAYKPGFWQSIPPTAIGRGSSRTPIQRI